METEMLLRIIAVVIAAVILFSNFDYSNWISYVKNFFRKKDVEVENVEFLEIVETWHKLRNQCEDYGLEEALGKIDEVFPLLNTED